MTPYLTISVIIPTYNRAHLVQEAIASVLSQTRVPNEIIVVDDGSTDDTPVSLQKYQSPVKVIRCENGGSSAARNTGIKAATGDLIAFLDDDDTLTANSVELRARYFEEHPETNVVYGDIQITDMEGNPQFLYSSLHYAEMPSGEVFGSLAKHNIAPIHAFMVRRICYEKSGLFDESLSCMEDYDLWIRLSQHFQFYFMDEVVGTYRSHTDQKTLANKQVYETDIKVRHEMFSSVTFAALSAYQRSSAYVSQATRYYNIAKLSESRYWSVRAILADPRNLHAYLAFSKAVVGRQLIQNLKKKFLRDRYPI